MPAIARDSLMTLEAYARVRQGSRPEAIAHRRRRSVALGGHMTLQFEDEHTVRRQIQEMLHIEKIFDDRGIQGELDAYGPLVPDGSNWKATVLIEYADPQERRRALARLVGVEDRLYVEIDGHGRVHAIADEDLPRDSAGKTSAVHFARFEFDAAQRRAILSGAALTLGCDHPHYPARALLSPETLASLAADLRAD